MAKQSCYNEKVLLNVIDEKAHSLVSPMINSDSDIRDAKAIGVLYG